MTALPGTTDTTVVGLITDNNETAYREEVRDLAMWCQDNNLSLNVIKTKQMIVDYRKKRTEHTPILINWAVVEQVETVVKRSRCCYSLLSLSMYSHYNSTYMYILPQLTCTPTQYRYPLYIDSTPTQSL